MADLDQPPRAHPARQPLPVLALLATIAFILLAAAAHRAAYFPIDLEITRLLQQQRGSGFARLMILLSWIGFAPQVNILGAAVLVALFATGHRRAAVGALVAGSGVAFGLLMKLIVARPRPVVELVTVAAPLHSMSFPSGHVLMATLCGGFLAFLACERLKSGPARAAIVAATVMLALLMGASRIYLGQHWFSDVVGAYLLGGVWLGLTLLFYRRVAIRDFVSRPPSSAGPAVGDRPGA